MGFGGKFIHNIRLWSKKFLPSFVINAIRSPGQHLQSRKKARARKDSPAISLERLVSDLQKAGIIAGDTVMVHSSLSRIGNVTGSAETVIKSLIDVIGPKGTLIMPCFNSAELMIKDMKHGRLLDLRHSPSAVGKITEIFRTMPGIYRSSHPFSSACALGKKAEYATTGHDTNPYVCHEKSPVGRLVELKGKIIGIGIPIAQGLGVAHYLEDTWDKFPFEVHSELFEVTYIDSEGGTITREVYRYDPQVSRTRLDYPEGAWIAEKLTDHFSRKGILRRFKYGEADSWIMDAVELYEELKHLASKGVTMYLAKKQLTDQNRDIENW